MQQLLRQSSTAFISAEASSISPCKLAGKHNFTHSPFTKKVLKSLKTKISYINKNFHRGADIQELGTSPVCPVLSFVFVTDRKPALSHYYIQFSCVHIMRIASAHGTIVFLKLHSNS